LPVKTNINTEIDVVKGIEVLKDINSIATIAIIFSIILVLFCAFAIWNINSIHKKSVDTVKDAYSSSLSELRKVIETLRKK